MSQPLDPPSVREAGERAHLLGTLKQSCWRRLGCSGVRRIKSKGAALTVLQHYFVCAFLCTVLWSANEIKRERHSPLTFPEQLYGPLAGLFLLFAFACPIAGWLADVHYGRYRMMRFGLRTLWIGAVYAVVWLLVLNHFSGDKKFDKKFINYFQGSGGFVLLLFLVIGVASFAANVVQFGMDQMPEASAQELSTLIHWFAWATFAGELTARVIYPIRYCIPGFSERAFIAAAIQFMIPATMLTLAVSCDFLFCGWLIREPERQNPLRTIALILKFAATHKYPIRYHAVSYLLAEKPTRIDYAKEKYGGPFSSEQVEDLKTFFRIMVVIVSSAAFIIPIFLYMGSLRYLWAAHIAYDKQNHCKAIGTAVSYSPSMCGILVIPLYEFILYPVVRNRVPNMLVRVGIAAAITATLSGLLLAVNIITHVLHPETVCMFAESSPHKAMEPVLWLRILSSIVAAIGITLFSTAMVEFTYAQSPYNMRGVLIGSVLSIIITTIPIAVGTFITWSQLKRPIKPSCDFYYFLFLFVCAIVGVVVLCLVAKYYKWRQREEWSNPGTFVERLYDRVTSEPRNGERIVN